MTCLARAQQDFSVQAEHDAMNIYEVVKFSDYARDSLRFSVSSYVLPPVTYEYSLSARELHAVGSVTYHMFNQNQYQVTICVFMYMRLLLPN